MSGLILKGKELRPTVSSVYLQTAQNKKIGSIFPEPAGSVPMDPSSKSLAQIYACLHINLQGFKHFGVRVLKGKCPPQQAHLSKPWSPGSGALLTGWGTFGT